MFKTEMGEQNLFELGNEEGKEEELIELEDWDIPEGIDDEEDAVKKITERDSYQKVEKFVIDKGFEGARIYVLANGAYILEYLDDKGDQKEVFEFDKDGELISFDDVKYTKKELEETVNKIKAKFKKTHEDLMDELLEKATFTKEM